MLGIYKRKILRKKSKKTSFLPSRPKKKVRKHTIDQEKKASFFFYKVQPLEDNLQNRFYDFICKWPIIKSTIFKIVMLIIFVE